MGMTIEELVETAQKYSCMIVTKDMWNTALGSVSKLQKIEQILQDIPYGGEATVRRIQEVVNNGNDE